MHGHAQPVRGLLATHRFDPFGDRSHIVARAHRREGAEHQSESQRKVLGYAMTFLSISLASAEPDASLREPPQHPMLN
jgi:hypothetical protein